MSHVLVWQQAQATGRPRGGLSGRFHAVGTQLSSLYTEKINIQNDVHVGASGGADGGTQFQALCIISFNPPKHPPGRYNCNPHVIAEEQRGLVAFLRSLRR